MTTNDLLKQQVCDALNNATASLEPAIKQRLAQSRNQAIEKAHQSSVFQVFPSFYRGAIAAGIVTLVLGVGLFPDAVQSPEYQEPIPNLTPLVSNPEQELNATDVLMSNENLDFLENMDMYEWLAANV